MPTDLLIIGNQLASDWEERDAEIDRRLKRRADDENHDTAHKDAVDLEYHSQDHDQSDDTDMYELPKDVKSLSRQIEMEVSMYRYFKWHTTKLITMQRPRWSNNVAGKKVGKLFKKTNEPDETPLTQSTRDNAKKGKQAIRPSGSSETEESAGSPVGKGKQKAWPPNSVSN